MPARRVSGVALNQNQNTNEGDDMKKMANCLIIALLLVIAELAIFSSSGTSQIQKPAALTMPDLLIIEAGASPGGTADLLGKWCMMALTKAYPKMTVRHTPGSSYDTLHRLENKEVEIGLLVGTAIEEAWSGAPPRFKSPLRNIRQLFAFAFPDSGLGCCVLKDSTITDIAQLKTLRIGIGKAGTVTGKVVNYGLKKVYGFDFSDIRAAGGLVHSGEWSGEVEMLAEGKLDAVIGIWNWPVGYIKQLDIQRGVRFLPFKHEFNVAVQNNFCGFGIGVVPPGVYKSQTAPYEFVSIGSAFFAHKDLPEYVVYNILKTIFADEGLAFMDLRSGRKAEHDWIPLKHATEMGICPWHPGAKKYYEEKGLKLAEPFLTLTK